LSLKRFSYRTVQSIINENSINEKGLIVALNPHSLSIVHRDKAFADAKLTILCYDTLKPAGAFLVS
jgi:hypothetical protein